MKKQRIFYFSYTGGKKYDINSFKQYFNFDNINKIIEPFCGSCAVSKYIFDNHDKNYKYVMNDIDPYLINFLKDMKKDKLREYIDFFNNNFNSLMKEDKSGAKSEWYKLRERTDLNMHEWFMVKRASTRRRMLDLRTKELKEEQFEQINKFCKGRINFKNKDYKEIFERYKDNEKVFMFLDPPYFNSFNAEYYKFKDGATVDKNREIIDNTRMYVDCVELLKTAKCKVLLIINRNAINEYLFRDFIKGAYKKTYSFSRNKCEHLIISNY